MSSLWVHMVLGGLICMVCLRCDKANDLTIHNPILPGYFADPTIKKFDEMYYIYSTTDGIKLASGQPTVWISKDLQFWVNQEMDIELPEGLTNCWAPDVQAGMDGRYYYFMGNCQFGCNIYGYVSANPVGPWIPIQQGEPVIPVGTGKERLPALDAQLFEDDDGKVYTYFGTWCTSFDGMGWAILDPNDEYRIIEEGYIPIEQIPHAFEAAYMIKKDSIYLLMYSAGDCRLETYSVHYAWSGSPTGPFNYGENNPILETNQDETIHGPGHHSIIEIEGENYILYHRHDNPHSTGGEFRQVCMDRLVFSNSKTIEKVMPTHQFDLPRKKNLFYPKNLALNAKTNATSHYHLRSPATRYSGSDVDYEYLPGRAVDDDNGTMWKASSSALPQALTLDLGDLMEFEQVHLQFEYPTFYYQYVIEVSDNGDTWRLFADQSRNQVAGSPMIERNEAKARFMKITIVGTEKTGMYAALWNVKVYKQAFDLPNVVNKPVQTTGSSSSHSPLVDLQLDQLSERMIQKGIPNSGNLRGDFKVHGTIQIEQMDGRKALAFDGNSFLELSVKAPPSLGWNAPFTIAAYVLNPEIGHGECMVSWNTREDLLQSSYAALMYGSGPYGAMAHGDGAVDLAYREIPEAGVWHHIAVSFDGMNECLYVDGRLREQMPLNLFVKEDRIRIGASGHPAEYFSGFISAVQIFDYNLPPPAIDSLYRIYR